MRGLKRRAAALIAATLTVGCYVYRPADLSDVRPDRQVRVTLSERGAARLGGAGRDVGRTFTALYLGRDDGGVMLAVPLLGSNPGTVTRAVHARVSLPPTEITTVESRKLSLWRTALVGAVGLAALGYAGSELLEGDAELDADEVLFEELPAEGRIRVPLFTIPVGW